MSSDLLGLIHFILLIFAPPYGRGITLLGASEVLCHPSITEVPRIKSFCYWVI